MTAPTEAGAVATNEERVKCSRCRHVHNKSDRKDGAPDKNGLTPVVCPRCGGHSYFKLPGAQS